MSTLALIHILFYFNCEAADPVCYPYSIGCELAAVVPRTYTEQGVVLVRCTGITYWCRGFWLDGSRLFCDEVPTAGIHRTGFE